MSTKSTIWHSKNAAIIDGPVYHLYWEHGVFPSEIRLAYRDDERDVIISIPDDMVISLEPIVHSLQKVNG